MIVYTFLRIVIENNKGTPEYVDLLKNSKICTIPIVNIDGYLFIEKKFKETGSLLEIRKNRRQTNCSP